MSDAADASAGTGLRGTALLDSVNDMRSTARWTIGALGAVGGLVLGGLPLAAVGKLNSGNRLWLAFAGLALATLGVLWAVAWTCEVLTPRFTTLRSLDAPGLKGLKARIAAEPDAFLGQLTSTPAELVRAYRLHALVAANLRTALAAEPDPNRRELLTRSLALAQQNSDGCQGRLHALLDLVQAWSVRSALVRARWHTLSGGLMVAAGVVLFLRAS
jgi:hypothetical protein